MVGFRVYIGFFQVHTPDSEFFTEDGGHELENKKLAEGKQTANGSILLQLCLYACVEIVQKAPEPPEPQMPPPAIPPPVSEDIELPAGIAYKTKKKFQIIAEAPFQPLPLVITLSKWKTRGEAISAATGWPCVNINLYS